MARHVRGYSPGMIRANQKNKGNRAAQRKRSKWRKSMAGESLSKGDTRGQQRRKNAKNRIEQQIARRTQPPPRFIGIDGEGLAVPNGERQPYVLLAASTGEYIESYHEFGLNTHECLTFLTQVARENRKAHLVIFGGIYDFTQIVTDLPIEAASELAQTGRTWFQAFKGAGWVIKQIPGKLYSAAPFSKRPKNLDKVRMAFTVHDAWGFFQSSFVRALEDWHVGTPQQRKRIADGKAARSTFSEDQRKEIREYCVTETRLLVAMMNRLAESVHQVDSLPMLRDWHGAGALASAVLEDRYAGDFISGDVPEEVALAYYGGRIETTLAGKLEPPLFEYDINSAYPAALARLPSMGGTWTHTDEYSRESEHGVWHVKWALRAGGISECFGPFPLRHKDSLWWPTTGEGWYVAEEVRAAIEVFGDDIDVLEGYTYKAPRGLPWAWVNAMYDERAAMKEEDARFGTYKNKPLKLALNAMYGKAAQRPVWRIEDHEPVLKRGKWRSDYVAAYATAYTRASLLRAAAQNWRAIVGFSTDSILSREPLHLPEGDGLGEWSADVIDSPMIVVQPGFRMTADGTVKRVRGGLHTSIGYDEFVSAWDGGGINAVLRSPQRRFIALRTAMGLGNVQNRGYWFDTERRISFRPEKREIGYSRESYTRLLPPDWPTGLEAPAVSEGIKEPTGKEAMEHWGIVDANVHAAVDNN